ncbi:AfsR/SARP family transcriptional regulator [Streptomyces sp. NBC_01210]|uniref:AfsR/SARP family transcriptional regulator n=1 Tax=Streptomyces sp. NBC_01210 TaxID=2903774 RepID=UPI002E14A909
MKFTVLGPVRGWRDDVELKLGPPKQRALLGLLLVRAGQPVSLSDIVDVMWGPAPPDSAVNVVHRHVGAVRRLLQPGLAARAPGDMLIRSSGGYRLDADADGLDLLRFRGLAEQGRRAAEAGSLREAAELLTQSLALWQGVTAAGLPEEVRSHPVFTTVDRERLAAVTQAAGLALRTGTADRVLPALQKSAAQHPLDEALQGMLMQVLAATGRQAEALEVYGTVRAKLSELLGISPAPELRAAHEQVLRRTDSAPTASRPDRSPRPDPKPTPGVPPVERQSSTAVRPAQLPAGLAAFTGRHAELTRALALLPGPKDARPSTTVVISAIDGMAGIGKTTLAVHLAHHVAHRFPDGQLYLNLRGFDPTGSVMTAPEALRTFLHALGVAPQHVPTEPDAQAALYRSLLAGRRVLILLDNVRDSQHVRPLLPGAPGCLVIVTSRNQLHGLIATDGAHPLTLGPLTAEEAREALVRRLGAGRVAAEPEAVEAIIRLCGQLPLALAVVAARAATRPDFPLASVAAELGSSHGNLDAFAGTDPSTDIRTVFSRSYDILDPEASRLFRLLALHPGGPDFSAPVAASLIGLPVRRTRALLAELTRAHLLIEHTAGRHTFHDLLRAYANELAQDIDTDGTRQVARHRMFDHYLHTAHAAATLLAPHRVQLTPLSLLQPGTGPELLPDHERAAAWLGTELSVLRSVIEQAASTGYLVHAWQLAQALDLFLDRRGRWQDQLSIQRTALDAARRLGDRLGQAHAHRALGFACVRLQRNDEAQSHLRQALALFTECGDRAGQARTRRSLAFMANGRGRHHEALGHYQHALDLYRSCEIVSGQASVLNETGWTHILLGQYESALERCGQAVELHLRIDDPNGEAAAWDSLGCAHHHLGQYEQALTCYGRALVIYQDISDHGLEADTLAHIGDTHDAQGDRVSANDAWQRALAILTEMGHPDADELLRRIEDADADG